MNQPVRRRFFFGLFLFSRTQFIIYQITSIAFYAIIWLMLNVWINSETKYGRVVDRDAPWVRPAINYLVYFGLICASFELPLYLRFFKKAERAQRIDRDQSNAEAPE